MEILKFDESGTSSPSRKRSGRSAILVTFVALVFGAGTALASGTLTINTNNQIALDQGVANSVQCDDNLVVSLSTEYQPTPTDDFVFTGVDVSEIDDRCDGKWFTIHTYDELGNLVEFCNVGVDGCTESGFASKKQVSVDPANTTLNYSFDRDIPTGELRGSSPYVFVQTVTVESTDA
jgi:hypothetical protein